MYSVEGQKLIAKYASVPVVTDVSAEELSEYLTPTMLSVMEAASRGDIKFVSGNPEMWYADLYVALRENLTNIVLNDITPDEFCANMEAAAKGVREDDSVAKYYTE